MTPSDPTIFGIRHHGPGSARSLVRSLTTLTPDVLLIEGPPEANETLSLLSEADLKPPVALLLYPPEHLQQAAYYPFAVFSPEWQALQYGRKHNLPIRFIDLPQSHQMAERVAQQQAADAESAASASEKSASEESVSEDSVSEDSAPEDSAPEDSMTECESPQLVSVAADPLAALAAAAGYTDSERWWEQLVEQRQDSTALFEAILEAMSALRADLEQTQPPDLNHPSQRREAQREAHMRKSIRQAQKEGFQRIAVICGAWHAPALSSPWPPLSQDNALLKGLPKVSVKATWIPWTYARLSSQSGYGAGITSPGWYDHLWQTSRAAQRSAGTSADTSTGSSAGNQTERSTQTTIRWLTKVARLLRKEDLDASSASVIEAVRLAEALAAMRESPMPGLAELNEATQTVLCFGDETPLKLIYKRLIISDRLGQVPASTPLIPLQQDLQRQQKRLRMKPEADKRLLTLDLRKELDLGRSHLLYRLQLLDIAWGKPERSSGKGTFKEAWTLRWQPELSLAIIEAGRWGNTVASAATAYSQNRAANISDLPELMRLLEPALLADLPAVVADLMQRLQNAAAIAHDLTHLMGALPMLANILRYRDVRQTDRTVVAHVVDGLVARICIGLPGACASLDDEAAAQRQKLIGQTHSAIKLLQQESHLKSWSAVLTQLCDQANLHGLIAGYSCRLLLDDGHLTGEETARRLGLALSLANEPTQAAAWVEGLLQGSGLLLLHDDTLWQVLDQWVMGLSADAFVALLPLLRRTFSSFSPAERRQMGERVRLGQRKSLMASADGGFDRNCADSALPLVAQLLGLKF